MNDSQIVTIMIDIEKKNLIIPTYYHGTDARIVAMTKEERCKYKETCEIALDYMWTFYQPYADKSLARISELKESLDAENDNVLYYNVAEKIRMNDLRINDNQLYQYGSLFLTTLDWRAENYAYRAFAGGEIGLIAYRLYQGIKKIQFEGWNPNDKVKTALNMIEEFANDTPKPVVFAFGHLKKEFIRNENGNIIDDELLEKLGYEYGCQNIRYDGELKLDIKDARYLKVLDE